MSNPSIGQKGILFDDIKGYEDNWRKHHTSSMARDIWWFDGSTYKKMTDFKGEDRNAVWNSDESGYYYLSEQDGTFNVYYRSLDNQENKQLTFYKDNPVRFLSASDNIRSASYRLLITANYVIVMVENFIHSFPDKSQLK